MLTKRLMAIIVVAAVVVAGSAAAVVVLGGDSEDDADGSVSVAGVVLGEGSASIGVGSTLQLTVTVSPSGADDTSVTWTSSDESVATVDSEGLVTAVSVGTATITATTTDGGYTASCEVTVVVPATGVDLDQASAELSVGGVLQLTATVSPSDATDASVTWSSSDESVATVDSDGLVTAVSAGTATITATTSDGGYTASCEVTVTVPAGGVSVSSESATIYPGETVQLTATVSPSDATDASVTWSSSDESVATVDSDGLVTAVSAGTATITATTADGGYTASCEVTVAVPVAGVDLDQASAGLSVGGTLQLTATVSPSDATDASVAWTSSDESVATVDSEGLVTAVSAGTATITATTSDGGYTASCEVAVVIPVTGVSLSGGSGTVYPAETVQLTATVSPSDATDASVTWSSSDESVATVDSDGLVTAVSVGTAVITATTVDGSYTASFELTVEPKPVTGVSIESDADSVGAEGTIQLTAVVSPSDATDASVTWSSSDESVATVDEDGLVTGVSVGAVTITATTSDGGYTATIALTITEKVPVTGVSLDSESESLYVRETVQLTATVSPSDATRTGVTWASSDESVATVDSDGLVTAVSAGTAVITVTASDGGYTATCTVTVSVKPVTGVSLDADSATLSVGETVQLTATVSPSDATDSSVVWASSDESVATVDSDGLVTAVSAGTATITVTTSDGGYTASFELTAVVPVTGVELDSESLDMYSEDTAQLTATVSPSDATDSSVVWASSDESVATVGSDGLVTAVSAGTATITVTTSDGGYTAACEVTVVQRVHATGVALDQESDTVYAGDAVQLTATVSPSDATDASVTWISSDESVATVDSDGLVTAVSAGTAVITATTADGGYTASFELTVVDLYTATFASASQDTGYIMVTVDSAAFLYGSAISGVEVLSGEDSVKVWDSEDGGLTVEITGIPVESTTEIVVTFSDGLVLYGTITASDGDAYLSLGSRGVSTIDFRGAYLETVAYLYDETSYVNWYYWGGNTSSYGVSDSATATSYDEMEELWSIVGDSSTSVWTTPGSAVCIDSYTYYYYSSVLYCVETLTGEVVATASCPSSSVYNMAIAYGDGMIFVPTKSGNYTILRAFDATTLEQLYVSVACEGGEVQGSITYYEGRVYFGTYSGNYYCFDATDLDTGSTDEEVSPLWIVEGSGWYNATPAFFDDLCVIAEKGYDIGGAVVYLVDTDTGAILDTVTLPYAYCTSGLVAYNGRVYVATSASYDGEETTSSSSKVMRIYSFAISGGLIDDDSAITWESDTEGGGTQSTPVIYNNRLYIAGGGATLGSNEPFTVLDIAEDGTMTLAYTVDLITKGTASVSTYYATVENNGLVYIYLMEYGHVYTGEDSLSSNGYAYIYCLSDCAGQTEANIVFTYLPSTTQFAYQSFTISPEGCLLIRNDIALFCYAPASLTYSATAVSNAIDRIIEDSEDGEVSYAEVQRVEERYAALSDEDKALVTNYDDLQALYVTVTFVYGDTTVVTKVVKGSLVNAPSVGSTDSYAFDCWMNGDEEWCLYTDCVTEDTTLVASYVPLVTVTFDSNGGSDVDSVTMAAGDVLGYMEDPTLDGYTFGGWYCDGVLYVAQYSAVDSDITLTALWLKDSTITFDSNGGSDVDSITVTYTLEIGDLPTPTRSGYTFIGWYYNDELFEDTVYQYEYGITLVAQWSVNSSEMTVDNGNGVYVTGTFPESVTVSLSKYSSSVSTSSLTALKNAAGDSSLECYMLQVMGEGVTGDYPVEISLPLGTGLSGETVTLWYCVSGKVTEVSGTVDEDGYLTVTVYGASAGSGTNTKVQIVFGIAEGTELSEHTGSAST